MELSRHSQAASEWNNGADASGHASVPVDAEPLPVLRLDWEAITENRPCHDERVSLAVAVDGGDSESDGSAGAGSSSKL